MKKLIYLFVGLILLMACNSSGLTERLNQIDSLVVKDQYDSAYALFNEIKATSMCDEDQAHYNLLASQLGFVRNKPLPSDSLLDLAIAYYNKVGNNHKLSDAYYYKSIRERSNQNYPQAILFCKESERLANNINDARLQFKIAENLSQLNALCDNYQLQLQYAQKALSIAQKEHNNNWIAYSYSKISYAFAYLDMYDSSYYYIEKSVPYYQYIDDSDKAGYLANIGLFYKDINPEKAKEYLEMALSYGEEPGIYEHLADIYFSEGKENEAYMLWKKAFQTKGRYEKSNILYSILSYDIERGRLDEVCKNIDQVIAIKDSMLYQLRNDTIKDLQMSFDHEVAMHEADRTLLKAQWIILGLISLLLLLSYYTFSRKKKEATLQKDHQMQLLAYTTEINKLKENRERTLAQIAQLKAGKDKDDEKIRLLEEDIRNAEEEIQTLNTDIKDLLDDLSPKLKQGRMLYDQICEGAPIVGWTVKEEELFNNYFASINYKTYDRLRKVKRASRLSTHNLFYLILKEIGKTDDEIRNIMGLSPEGLRSIRSRTKPV